MIVKALMEALKALILFVIGLFPALPDLSFVAEYVTGFVDLVRRVNMFVSLPVVGLCLFAIIVCYNVRAIWSVVMWVLRKIPGVS